MSEYPGGESGYKGSPEGIRISDFPGGKSRYKVSPESISLKGLDQLNQTYQRLERPKVEVISDENGSYLLSELLFCTQCDEVCPPTHINITHDYLICPNCMHPHNLLESTSYLGRCLRCFECPICFVVLTPTLNSDETSPNYSLFCPNCYWDSKSHMSLSAKTPKDLITELIELERNMNHIKTYTPLSSFYKQIATRSSRLQNLKSALKERYADYTLHSDPEKMHLEETSKIMDEGKNPSSKSLKKNVWIEEYPSMLSSVLPPSYIKGHEIFNKLHPNHTQNIHQNETQIPQSDTSTHSTHKAPLTSSHFTDQGSYKSRDMDTDFGGRISKDDEIFRDEEAFEKYSKTTLNQRLRFNFYEFNTHIMPSRIPLISKPTKKCSTCNSILLSPNKALSSATIQFPIDNRALIWLPKVTVKNTDLIENGKSDVFIIIKNPLEKPIYIEFDFEINTQSSYTLDVLSEPFGLSIDPYDSIKEIIDSEEEDDQEIDVDTLKYIQKKKNNMVLIPLQTSPKPDTKGKNAQFAFQLNIKFEDVLTNTHNTKLKFLVTLGSILSRHVQTLETL